MNVQGVWWITGSHLSLCSVKSSHILDEHVQETLFVTMNWIWCHRRAHRLCLCLDGTLKLWYCKYHECTSGCFPVWLQLALSGKDAYSIQYCNEEGKWLQSAVLCDDSKLEFCFLAQKRRFYFICMVHLFFCLCLLRTFFQTMLLMIDIVFWSYSLCRCTTYFLNL